MIQHDAMTPSCAAEFSRCGCALQRQMCSSHLMFPATALEAAPAVQARAAGFGRCSTLKLQESERYVEQLWCGGRHWLFSRVAGQCGYAIVARTLSKNVSTPHTLLPCSLTGLGLGASFRCMDDQRLAVYGPGKGGLVRSEAVIDGAHGRMWSWSRARLIHSSDPDLSGCIEMRKLARSKISPTTRRPNCVYDGKPWVVVWRDRVWLYARANMNADGGARHVHVSTSDASEIQWSPFRVIHIANYSIQRANNIYFWSVHSRGSELVALFPAVIDGLGGVYASRSSDGVAWDAPTRLMDSPVIQGERTQDHPVSLRSVHRRYADSPRAVDVLLEQNVQLKLNWRYHSHPGQDELNTRAEDLPRLCTHRFTLPVSFEPAF